MKKILFVLLSVVSVQFVYAQAQSSRFTLNWDMNLPLGSTTDYIGKYQFRGINGQYRYFVNNNIGVGFDLGYNGWYDKKSNATYKIDGQTDITGTFYNYNRMWTFRAAGDYLFLDDSKKVRPYLGLGIGVNTVDLEYYIIDYVVTVQNEWPFSVAPEAGIEVSALGSHVGFNLGISYNYTAYDYSTIIKDLSYMSFKVGVTWH